MFDPLEAMREGAPILHEGLARYPNAPRPVPAFPNVHSHVKWQLGDCEKGFAESDFVFEQTFTTQRVHQARVEGGMVQGLGFALLENLPDQEGKITAASLGEYKIPVMSDIPCLETIHIYDPAGPGPFQSKPIGENTTTPTAAAIANAVYDAIGVQIRDLPMTSEKIYFALKNGGVQ